MSRIVYSQFLLHDFYHQLHSLYLRRSPTHIDSHFLVSNHSNYSMPIFSVLRKAYSTIMMRSFAPLAVALLLPAVLACENPDTHSCASIFTASTALVTSFCATYTASDITATTPPAIPSAISSACSGLYKTISEACTCFVTPRTAATVRTSLANLFETLN